MTNETAIKFAEICGLKNPQKCEISGYIEECVTVEDVVQGKATQADFASPRHFMPDSTDDVLVLAIEWCKNHDFDHEINEYVCRIRGIFPRGYSRDTICYTCTIDVRYDFSIYGTSKSLPDAIMQAVINAAEKL